MYCSLLNRTGDATRDGSSVVAVDVDLDEAVVVTYDWPSDCHYRQQLQLMYETAAAAEYL